MQWIERLRQRARVAREHFSADLDEEMRFHLDEATQANIEAGMPPDEARYAALRRFGNVAHTKEESRQVWLVPALEAFAQDLRYGARMLGRIPGFTIVAVLTLALGIGANTAIFSMVNAVMLKPLPYAGGGELLTFRGNHSVPDIRDIASLSQSFSSVGTFADFPLDLVGGDEPRRVDGGIVAGDVFPALGTPAMLGRFFTRDDDEAREPVVVLSYDFWQRWFASDRSVLGRTLALSGQQYTVIGVMPSGFKMPFGTAELWLPFRVGYPEGYDARGAHFTFPVARLKPGITMERAQLELDQLGKKIAALNPLEARTFVAMPLRDRMVGALRTPLLVLLGAVGCVLLIACGNFANLLLARVAARRQEMQVRSALGAGPWRLVRQLVTESLLLSAFGGALSILFAVGGVRLLLGLKPKAVHLFYEAAVDLPTLLFALGLSLVTGVVFGLAPALQLWAEGNLQQIGARATARSALRRILVVLELATALMLLVGAGLLLRSFWKLRSVDSGLRPERVATMKLSFPAKRYNTIAQQAAFLEQLDRDLRTMPGAQSAGMITELPLTGMHMEHNVAFADRKYEAGKEPEVAAHEVSASYFDTVGMPVVLGRGVNDQDRSDSMLVGVVNHSMAQQYWPEGSPIGARVRWARAEGPPRWITIVGVVGDVRFDGLDQQEMPTLYTPLTQKQQEWKRWVSVVVRTRGDDALAIAPEVRRRVWRLDPQLPITDLQPLTAVLADSVAAQRFDLMLLLLFAGLALALAVIGIYGVISYLVTQRTREIGVRMALGAQRSHVIAMVVGQGMTLTLVGIGLGVGGALVAVRVLEKLLFGVSTTDPLTFAAVVAILAVVALLASYVPARRASRIDPVIALRYE